MWQSTGIFIDESESLPFRVRVATCRHLPPAHVDISLAITKNNNNNGDNGNLTPSHSSSIKINNLFTQIIAIRDPSHRVCCCSFFPHMKSLQHKWHRPKMFTTNCFSIHYEIHYNLSLDIFRAAIQAISTYLEAFQKIADAATNSKGMWIPLLLLVLLSLFCLDIYGDYIARELDRILIVWLFIAVDTSVEISKLY